VQNRIVGGKLRPAHFYIRFELEDPKCTSAKVDQIQHLTFDL